MLCIHLLTLAYAASFSSFRPPNAIPQSVTIHDGVGEDGNSEITCYYNDSYFTKAADDYDPSLATMSAGLAYSAFNSHSDGYENKSENVQSLLADINFTNISVNDAFNKQPEPLYHRSRTWYYKSIFSRWRIPYLDVFEWTWVDA